MEVLNVLSVLFLCLSLSTSERQDVHEMMYQTLSGAAGCFRRMNGTHQFGCSSPRKGSYGVIQMVDTTQELDFIIDTAISGPYMVVLSPLMIGPDVINRLKKVPEKISGIVFTDRHKGEKEFPSFYSPDDTCPNSAESTCVKDNPWNPQGNNYLFTDWNVPLFLIKDEANYTTIVDCYTKFNLPLDETQETRPLCSLHMKSHMFAAVSSRVCSRRVNNNFVSIAKFCDPIGNENVVLPLKSSAKSTGKIIIASRIDSASLFDGVAPGAISSVTGLVTALTTASIIHEYIIKSTKDVIFILFNGEAFDYIGSTRIIYDMNKKTFISKTNPVALDDIELFIDISQIGRMKEDSDTTTFIHATGTSALDFSKKLIERGSLYNATFAPSSIKELPPTSFTKFNSAAPKMNGIVITNYDKSFKSKYYEGYYDTYETLGYKFLNGSTPEDSAIQSQIASVSASLATTLALTITDKTIKNIDMDALSKKVDQLLYCYLVTRSCPLFEIVHPSLAYNENLPQLLSLYVGVPQATNHMTKATGLLLSYMASPSVNISRTDCFAEDPDADQYLLWLSGGDGICLNTTLKFTPAVSPAFVIDDYDWNSGQYPTWTESVWDDNSLGMFLKPSRQSEIRILLTGMFTFVSTFIAIFYIKKNSENLFFPKYPTNC